MSFCFLRREAIPMRVPRMWQKVCQQLRQKEALPCPHKWQAILLPSARMREDIHTP